ncbi:MAG TPA: hypothetical protein VL068_12840, partial [Microthrixaceae bacterium]|nr:hypothetical protein [Microthrixaceae bacterium]
MNINEDDIDSADLLYVHPTFAAQNNSKTVRAGDILTVRTGHPGISAVVPTELDRCQTFTQLITTVTRDNCSRFVCLALNSGQARSYFDAVSWGSAQKNISVPLLAGAPVPFLPLAQQRVIVDSVDSHQQQWSRTQAALTKQLHLLI